jgi:hypothetical protein
VQGTSETIRKQRIKLFEESFFDLPSPLKNDIWTLPPFFISSQKDATFEHCISLPVIRKQCIEHAEECKDK